MHCQWKGFLPFYTCRSYMKNKNIHNIRCCLEGNRIWRCTYFYSDIQWADRSVLFLLQLAVHQKSLLFLKDIQFHNLLWPRGPSATWSHITYPLAINQETNLHIIPALSKTHLKECDHAAASVDRTFTFQEVEGAQKGAGRGYFRLTISCELGELIPWKVYESSDTAEYQIREVLWVLMSQPLHKKVGVKDHRLACIWLFLAGKHTAFCPPVTEKQVDWLEGK